MSISVSSSIMTEALEVRPLGQRDLLKAYPVVAAIEGFDVTPERWEQQVRAWLKGEEAGRECRGVMGIYGPSGYIYGLFFHRVVEDIRHGPTLEVSQLRVLEVSAAQLTLHRSLEATETLAKECRCGAILFEIPAEGVSQDAIKRIAPKMDKASGYAPKGLRLLRPLAAEDNVVALRPYLRGGRFRA